MRRRAVTPPSAPGEFRAGFNYHMARYADADNAKCLKALVQSGAKLVRASIGATFGVVKPKEAVCDWTKPDRCLALLERNGLALDTIVYGTPDWAVDEKHSGLSWTLGRWRTPVRRGAFREFCRALAARYGTRIAWYEIGNEWDLIPPEAMDTDEAIEMQREGYEGVKAGCPEAKVIPNGWAVVHSDVIPHRTQRDMQERMMTEAVDFYDAHPVHQHGPYREYRRRLAEFFAWRKAKGIARKPWYSNETAQTTSNVGEERIAECVWQKILHAWAHGSVDYIWYNLRAIGFGPYDGESGYGVVTGDFYPRATYAAFAGLTSCFERHAAGLHRRHLGTYRREAELLPRPCLPERGGHGEAVCRRVCRHRRAVRHEVRRGIHGLRSAREGGGMEHAAQDNPGRHRRAPCARHPPCTRDS